MGSSTPSNASAEGRLFLLPVWLGDAGGPESLPAENNAIAAESTLFFAENERTARRLLRRMVPTIDLPSLEIHRLDKDTAAERIGQFIGLLQTRDGVILSEAGMPGIADPGARLVAAAHRAGIRVVPLAGPSSILLAIAASGLNGQAFTFHGYLPRDAAGRKQAIKALESAALRTGASQAFIETPYRNEALFDELLRSCANGTLLCVAADIGQPGGSIVTRTVEAWRRLRPMLKDRPAVFVLGVEPR